MSTSEVFDRRARKPIRSVLQGAALIGLPEEVRDHSLFHWIAERAGLFADRVSGQPQRKLEPALFIRLAEMIRYGNRFEGYASMGVVGPLVERAVTRDLQRYYDASITIGHRWKAASTRLRWAAEAGKPENLALSISENRAVVGDATPEEADRLLRPELENLLRSAVAEAEAEVTWARESWRAWTAEVYELREFLTKWEREAYSLSSAASFLLDLHALRLKSRLSSVLSESGEAELAVLARAEDDTLFMFAFSVLARSLSDPFFTYGTEGGYDRYDLRLMSWGDGSGVPASGNNLVIVGIDNNDRLHIRIFDAGGGYTDTDETRLRGSNAGAIWTIKQQLPGLLPPHVLTNAEKAQLINEATSIAGYTRYYTSPILGLIKSVERMSRDLRRRSLKQAKLAREYGCMNPFDAYFPMRRHADEVLRKLFLEHRLPHGGESDYLTKWLAVVEKVQTGASPQLSTADEHLLALARDADARLKKLLYLTPTGIPKPLENFLQWAWKTWVQGLRSRLERDDEQPQETWTAETFFEVVEAVRRKLVDLGYRLNVLSDEEKRDLWGST